MNPIACQSTSELPTCLHTILDTTVAQFVEQLRLDQHATVFANLLDVVLLVGLFTSRLGLLMLQTYVDVRFMQTKSNRRTCSCGEPMEWHGDSRWSHGTIFGQVRVKDVYAYCRSCHSSARPLHGWLGTGAERWSMDVEQKAVDLASDESCQHAVDKLSRLFPGVEMNRTTALRMLHRHGISAREFLVRKLASAVNQTTKQGCSRVGIAQLEIEHDAGMIPVATLKLIPTPEGQEPKKTPIRGLPVRKKDCRWEEAKLGLVQVPGEEGGRLYSVRTTRELNEAFEDLLALACMKGWSEQTQVRGLADGARHIRPRMEQAFRTCSFQFILDRPHAKDHLDNAGLQLEKLGRGSKETWARNALDLLEAGRVPEVVEELRLAANPLLPNDEIKKTLRLEADYFERNQDAVAYQTYRDQGWSTASSEVESGHRSVVQVRLKLPGTWWHPDNVQNILALRMVKANGWWDEYWEHQRQIWNERAMDLQRHQPRTKIAYNV